ncbi:MAG: type IX secretion system outer membrane channel protein PorV [Flavobacteriia bacterium]|jgi:hypothetical protein
MRFKKSIILSLALLIGNILKGQENQLNTITTAVPFASIISNAQSMGSGYVGVVASENYMQNGLDQNPALLANGKKVMGFQVLNYSPWLKGLAPDIKLFESAYYQDFGKHALGFSARQFSLGEITTTGSVGNLIHKDPNEYFLNLKYAYAFSKNFSLGCGLKYIHSDLTNGATIANVKTHPAKAIAMGFGFNYRKAIYQKKNFKVNWNLGLAFLNIGNKVSYSDSPIKDFIPQELKLGTLFTFQWKQKTNHIFELDLGYQASKLLVPSPPIYEKDSLGNNVIVAGFNPEVNTFQGILQSFYDAPTGKIEEWREIIHQVGTEARFQTQDKKYFGAIRAGYFYEHYTKGNRKLVTLGLGFGYKIFRLDVAQLFPVTKNSTLKQTYCVNFSLRFDMDGNNFFKSKKEKKAKTD